MAIYHLSVQAISRGKGKSCVASAAYRAGEKLKDDRQDLVHDYSKKNGVESEILAPSNAPEWVKDRNKLWNEVDKAETRCNSRTARELNVALPKELSKEQQKELAREFVKENFVDKGMVADVCFHFNDVNNPHFHVMLTTREIDKEGFKKKNRDWDKKENTDIWREQWSKCANKALEKAGFDERIDHRSFKDRGIDKIPTIHLGKDSSEMKKKGIDNPRVEANKRIKEINQEKEKALKEYKELKDKLQQKEVKENQRYSHMTEGERSDIQRAESLIKKPQTYDNSRELLNKLSSVRNSSMQELFKINLEVGNIKNKSNSIKNSWEGLKQAQNELARLPKNIFGSYKDKGRAEILRAEIDKLRRNLIKDGGVNWREDLKLNEGKLQELQGKADKIKSDINVIDKSSKIIEKGVKALQNKELREFYKEYAKQFPRSKYYFSHKEMRQIKKMSKLLGRPVSINELKAMHKQLGDKLQNKFGANEISKANSMNKENNKLENTNNANDTKSTGKGESALKDVGEAFNLIGKVLDAISNARKKALMEQGDNDLTNAFKGRDRDDMEL